MIGSYSVTVLKRSSGDFLSSHHIHCIHLSAAEYPRLSCSIFFLIDNPVMDRAFIWLTAFGSCGKVLSSSFSSCHIPSKQLVLKIALRFPNLVAFMDMVGR